MRAAEFGGLNTLKKCAERLRDVTHIHQCDWGNQADIFEYNQVGYWRHFLTSIQGFGDIILCYSQYRCM